MSLLTQFYPGPGGGGSSGTSGGANVGVNPYVQARGGFASVAYSTYSVSPAGFSPADLAPGASGAVVFGLHISTNTTNGATISDSWKELIISNAFIARIGVPANSEKITLDNSHISFLNSTVGATNFTGIYGTGSMGRVQPFISLPNFTTWSPTVTNTSTNLDLSGNNAKLDAASVNGILEGTNIYQGSYSLAGAVLNLSGGTSAGLGALTAAGLAARTALVANGWTITLNP
jgi:hypothetical protein